MKLGIRIPQGACRRHAHRSVRCRYCGALLSGRTVQHTVQGCAAYGLHAIEHHITVTWKPVPCRGLSKAEVNQAVAMVRGPAASDARKAILEETGR